ncbi:hypothetical protein [Paenibacillus endoradicis]|uniref:hypothetical protein n=1 Tax=Paenibacillus endoradicis TaxID=2972487 RepID=UPI002158D3C2|nr:hypothetical protein [Paenibacillus endoradicis]MCR8656437.1 hypothetical protein [Paenibacillus endoradicis]
MNRLSSFRFLTYASIVVTIICFIYSIITYHDNKNTIAVGFLILAIILTFLSILLLLDLYSTTRNTVNAEVISIYGRDMRIRLSNSKEMTIRIAKREYKLYKVEDLLTVDLTTRTRQIISLHKI